MKEEEKNVLIKVVWFSEKRPVIARFSVNELQRTVYCPVRIPLVIKVEKTAENKWELKIGGGLLGYPGQEFLFLMDTVSSYFMYGGTYPARIHYVSYSLCFLETGGYVRDLLKLRLSLCKVKSLKEAKFLLDKIVKNVYWSEHPITRMAHNIILNGTTTSDFPLGKIKGLSKNDIAQITFKSNMLLSQKRFFQNDVFSFFLKKAYFLESFDEFSLFACNFASLGIFLEPVESLELSYDYFFYLFAERYRESGAVYNFGDEFRKGADWLQMAGVERKKNGESRKWTLEEEVFKKTFSINLRKLT